MAINAQEIQGQWNQLKGQVKEKWGQLSDDDLTIQGGNIDQLVGRIQQKTGEGREAVEKFLGDLSSKGASALSQASEAAGKYAQVAGDRLREGYSNLSDEARQRLEAADHHIRSKPSQSVAAAVGVGIVVGLVVGLAIRSK